MLPWQLEGSWFDPPCWVCPSFPEQDARPLVAPNMLIGSLHSSLSFVQGINSKAFGYKTAK